MDANKIEMTAEGRQHLLDELEEREGKVSREIATEIKEAKAHGDLSENAEYDAAKEKQAKNEARIAEIKATLAVAVVVAESEIDNTVSIGSTVTLVDADGVATDFSIVGTTETNSLKRKISNESPVGKAIIGHAEGETVEVVLASGRTRIYTIAKISR